jgi:hypothetical protein
MEWCLINLSQDDFTFLLQRSVLPSAYFISETAWRIYLFQTQLILSIFLYLSSASLYCHVVCVTVDGVFDWGMDLLTVYTHVWELQAITVPPLISTVHKSPQHLLSLFQPAVSSPAVPWQLLLTVEILQLNALKSSRHRLPYRTDESLTLSLSYNISRSLLRNGSARNNISSLLLPSLF